MSDLKKKVEALLFSSGKRMGFDEIAKLCKANPEDVKQSLAELKKEYLEKDSSLMLVEEGNSWKLTVREQYLPIVQKVVTETELSKTILETLAVIAFKYPILQSDLIKVRTNKAYEHLNELEEAEYITRQKKGRTKLIKLTDRFFEYFDLPRGRLKEQFKDFESIAKAIEGKEQEIEETKLEQRKNAEEAKKEDERIRQAADSVDEEKIPLQTYEPEMPKEKTEKEEKTQVIGAEGKLGSLEVVDEPPEEELEKERERIERIKEEGKTHSEEKKEGQEEEKTEQEKSGLKLTKEMEEEVDKKVEGMLHPPKEENGEEKEKKEKQEEAAKTEEEPKDLLEAAREEEEKEGEKEESKQ